MTNSTSLYQTAENYYQRYKLGDQNGVFNWDSKTPGLAVLFAQIAQSSSQLGGNPENWQAEAERYFDNIVKSKSPGHLTKSAFPKIAMG